MRTILLVAVTVAGVLVVGQTLLAEDPAETIRRLQEQVRELEQRVNSLEHRRETNPTVAAAKTAPELTLGSGGLSIASGGGEFKLRLRGYAQADARFYLQDSTHALTDSFLLNRVRPVFEGTVFRNYDFKVMPDFGQGKAVVQDAYIDAHFLPWLSLRAGKYKGPVGLERLQSARDLVFVERALPTDLVPNRDVGLAVHGDLLGGALSYEAGVFNGAADGRSDDVDESDSKDVEGRLFARPFKRTSVTLLRGLGLGVAGTFGHENGAAPAYTTIGQQPFFSFASGVIASGTRTRVAPQGYYYWGPFGMLGEYVLSAEDVGKGTVGATLRNSAWQVAGSYVLTGEQASYTGVVPDRPFDLRAGGWGALELAARVSRLDVDPKAFSNFGPVTTPNLLADSARSAGRATSWGVGLNWYLNRSLKFVTDYELTYFRQGAAAGNREAEQVLFSRLQIVF
jgi:phosphate-selective porin OprO and OprP